jgi:hypothetical protein
MLIKSKLGKIITLSKFDSKNSIILSFLKLFDWDCFEDPLLLLIAKAKNYLWTISKNYFSKPNFV